MRSPPTQKDRTLPHDARHMPTLGRENFRALARQLLPGLVLPGVVYFSLVRHTGMMTALAIAASVPALDTLGKLVRGRRPGFAGTAFLAVTGVSIALATWLDAPWFILGKGAATSAVVGIALVLSAAMGRPLTRTVALLLLTEEPNGRRELAERWSRPQTMAVFRSLALGWGLWLLISAVQQGALVVTVSPGIFMAVEPPIRSALTGIGVGLSVAYVRRRQQADPGLALLPAARPG